MSHPYDLGEKKHVSILGPTLKFKGELSANEDLVIQGQIEGSINHTSNLTIGKEGKVKANVNAEHIAIEGQVDGDLEGRNSVVVKDSANVEGNIYSPVVTLHEGAKFNGRIDMSGKAKPIAESPQAAASGSEPEPVASAANDDENPAKKSRNERKRSGSAA